jgi:hypothetical protein
MSRRAASLDVAFFFGRYIAKKKGGCIILMVLKKYLPPLY